MIALVNEIVGRDGELAHGRAPTGRLTQTEQRIADVVCDRCSNNEIATMLFVTVKTVERSLTRIFEELEVRRAELAARSPARVS